jgi:hypothetical protein
MFKEVWSELKFKVPKVKEAIKNTFSSLQALQAL